MLTIHHLGVSQSERILGLCEELLDRGFARAAGDPGLEPALS
jgi:hypothetical protein